MTTPHEGARSDGASGDDAVVAEGLRVGETLDASNLVLVLGDDPRTTALAALGVARAQSGRRRVALGDLLGDAEPIQQLLDNDDPHGLADSFVYGVSLNKIAHAVPQYGELYLLPSGSEVPAYDEIFTNSRWKRLAAGFRETGALLVVAAPATAARVGDVVDLSDGALLVGDAELSGVDATKLIGRVRSATAPNGVAAIEPAVAATSDGGVTFSDAPRPWWRRLPIKPAPAAALGLVIAAGLAALGIWLAARPLASGHEPLTAQRRRTASAAGSLSTLDSLHPDSASAAAAAAAALPTPANPADSAAAAAYSVLIARFNTRLGAEAWLQSQTRDLPSPTFAPQIIQGEMWYRALAGSFQTRAQAESLLAVLSAKGLSRLDSNNVVQAPFAFLVDSVNAAAVSGMLKYFVGRGQPVYGLRQPDGSWRLYYGAFESPEQASLSIDAIRASGIRPILVYRLGRVF
ncbi:MAG TPA: SPOR domain-containing protein [Gemmatimonadaceae bacterium]